MNAATRVQAVTRGHLSRQNSKMMSVDLPALVNLWLDAGFEMIAWDFDRTVLRVHAYARGVKVEEVPSRWEQDVADLDFFRAMVLGARQRGIGVGIASFGRQPVVLEYLRHMFEADAPGLFTAQNVLTPGVLPGYQDGMDVKNGKPMLLELLCSTAGVGERGRVLFFDDDFDNIVDCKAAGYVNAFHTPDNFARYSLSLIAKALPGYEAAYRPLSSAAAAPPAPPPMAKILSEGVIEAHVQQQYKALMAAGHAANRAGQFDKARQCFVEANAYQARRLLSTRVGCWPLLRGGGLVSIACAAPPLCVAAGVGGGAHLGGEHEPQAGAARAGGRRVRDHPEGRGPH